MLLKNNKQAPKEREPSQITSPVYPKLRHAVHQFEYIHSLFGGLKNEYSFTQIEIYSIIQDANEQQSHYF